MVMSVEGKKAAAARVYEREAGDHDDGQPERAMEQGATMTERLADARLIEACRQGSRDAFRLLYEIYKDHVYSIALSFFHGDQAAAEDITQEVFLKLFSRIGQYRGDAEFTTWLYRIAANLCLDEQRRRKRVVPFEDAGHFEPREARESPEDTFQRHEVAGAVHAALAGLSPELRLTLILKYFEELSYDEMARVLGCSPGTVASRLHRGLKMLGSKLAHLRPSRTAGDGE
jgi:RNA polymerase sigma-70 factor, ECF subfamily